MSKTKTRLNLNSKTYKTILIAALLLLPLLFRNYDYGLLIIGYFAIYTIAVSGLDILFGYSGQISMGHAAFFAIGAYGSAIMHEYLHIPAIITTLLAAIIATIIGALLAYPASKLKFHFLSLATIAFQEIVYQLAAQSPGGITGNFTGFFTEPYSIFGFKIDSNTRFYYFALVVVFILLLSKQRLVKSKEGRALIAIKENSQAANGMGINVRKYKVIAFATSAFYTAIAGGMYAHFIGFISPETFSNKQSTMFLTMVLFGGSGSIAGPILGAGSILLLNEGLRFAERYQMLIYGVVLLFAILVMPGGLNGVIKNAIAKRKQVKQNADS